jgi:translation initiation factor IF-3
VNQAKGFIAEGKNVQFNLQFKGHREMSHKEQGFAVINKIVADLAGVCAVEKAPKMEGNRITCRLTPKG